MIWPALLSRKLGDRKRYSLRTGHMRAVAVHSPRPEAGCIGAQLLDPARGRHRPVKSGFGLWQLAWGSKQTLNAANYASARAQMQGFRADGGRVLGGKPSVLVVAPALEEAALKLINSENGSGGETNPWKGRRN